MPEVHRKLVRAAARVHRASGLTVAAHSCDGVAALETLEILRGEGVGAAAFLGVHANAEPDKALHIQAAKAGAWVEFDGIGPGEVARHVEMVRAMKEAGQLNRVLLSHDAGWYNVGEPGGGKYRPHDTLAAQFVPALIAAGLDPAEIRLLTVENPRDAFMIRGRQPR